MGAFSTNTIYGSLTWHQKHENPNECTHQPYSDNRHLFRNKHLINYDNRTTSNPVMNQWALFVAVCVYRDCLGLQAQFRENQPHILVFKTMHFMLLPEWCVNSAVHLGVNHTDMILLKRWTVSALVKVHESFALRNMHKCVRTCLIRAKVVWSKFRSTTFVQLFCVQVTSFTLPRAEVSDWNFCHWYLTSLLPSHLWRLRLSRQILLSLSIYLTRRREARWSL